jgi:coproporphyrinogen III oxidase
MQMSLAVVLFAAKAYIKAFFLTTSIMTAARSAPFERMETTPSQAQREQAARWFEELRTRLCAMLEALEDEYATKKGGVAGRFERKSWERPTAENLPGGGGVMALMRGQLFEKAGVNVSTVYGHFSPQFRAQIPGAAEDGIFWAAGTSMVIHPRNPKVPALHMNTRHIVTKFGWFGGGADLNPVFPDEADTKDFHARLKAACDSHSPEAYVAYKKWCDEYFYIPHRAKARGVGGIFYDDLSSGDWARDFSFTQQVGQAVLGIYPQIVRRHMFEDFSPAEREAQLVWRGHYAEFNLVYDRGTKFGLATGGNTEAVLMSLPPEAKWP